MSSRIVTRKMKLHDKMNELNHLGAALLIEPQKFEPKFNMLFSAMNYYSSNPLTSILWKEGSEKVLEGTNTWEWELESSQKLPIIVKRVIGSAPYGLGRSTIKVVLDTGTLKPGDVISPGTSGHKYQSRVMESGVRVGSEGWMYVIRLKNDDIKASIPERYFRPGTTWVKLWSEYEEGAEQDGSTRFGSKIYFQDKLGKFRKGYEVTDYVAEQVLSVWINEVDEKTGKVRNKYRKWINYAEAKAWKDYYKELEAAVWYNRHTKSIYGSTGRQVDNFSGIVEKLEDSNRQNYNVLTARLLEEFLMDIYYSRISPDERGKLRVYTGEQGMLMFSRAMNDLLEKRGWTIVGSTFNPVEKTKSPYHTNAYSIGYQFTQYKLHNGLILEVVHNPIQDDLSLNTEIDPYTNRPLESMKFYFLDFGNEDVSSNIKLVTKSNGFKFGYKPGLVHPFGKTKNPNVGMIATEKEAYSFHISKQIGVEITDITRCGVLEPSRII